MSVLDRQVTEKAFTAQVIELAQRKGWMTAHFRAAQNRRGQWSTPVQGDGQGWPDLTLLRLGGLATSVANDTINARPFEAELARWKNGWVAGTRLIFAELKREGAYPEPAQREWLAGLALIGDAEVYVWRPSDWDEIAEVLA